MTRRTRYEMYLDLLETVRGKGFCTITRISYGVRLPVDRTKRIVRFLLLRGLLKEENMGDKKVYRITERGGEFLEALRTIRKFVE